jgi:purine/pyrimidine-nucleoside phosphorylase
MSGAAKNLWRFVCMDHNVYFEGRVQSLTLETAQGRATVGVITPGKYTFSTSTQEKMLVTSGVLGVKLSQEDWKIVGPNQDFVVAANASFDVEASKDVSYICYYG